MERTVAFTLLAKPIQEAIVERGFSEPTEPQEEAIPLILSGENVLIVAPTASGKTEAAVLPILSMLTAGGERVHGIKILYITPLRALNRDLLERLIWWCSKLDLKVAVRHGDTEANERGRQSKDPPDMLITTPETLQAILVGRVMRRHLRQVRWIIIDEVHELAEDKRGSQLSLALERLRWLTMRDFQVVGLSATIGTPEIVAKFIAGAGKEVKIVKVPVARRMRIDAIFPQPEGSDYELAEKLYTHPEVAARLRVMRGFIDDHNSVLLFTNTRAIAEVLASRFKVWDVDFPVSIHHGSLAKPARLAAERGLKEGGLKGVIATSSLELGIDVGRIDFVIQYMSPRQVTRLIQRVGRSGHKVGMMADGLIVAMDSDDLLEAAVIARRALIEELEPVSVPTKPLDVMCHQLAGLLLQKGRWRFAEILEIFKRAYPYQGLSEDDLVAVLSYMHSRSPRLAWVSFEDKVVLRPRNLKALYEYYFDKLSMIPDEKQYLVMDQTSGSPVGVLDEAFVAEYGEPGVRFIIRGSPWKINSIQGDTIYVRPLSDPTGAIPSWVGEEIPVPFEVGQEVGELRRKVAEAYLSGRSAEEIANDLAHKYPVKPQAFKRALLETFHQVDLGLEVPSDRIITVEDWEDYVILTAHLGLLVNRTLARLLGHLLSEDLGISVGIQQDAYRIIIQTLGAADSETIIEVFKRLTTADVDKLLIEATKKTGLFKRRIIHVARRFGAISRWVDFSNVSLSQLVKGFEGSVIFEEAIKEALEKDLDVRNAKKILAMLANGEIKLVRLEPRGGPSPIARIGIERIGMKTDIIPADKMKRILIGSAKARIANEVRVLVCVKCWGYTGIMRVLDLPEELKCPNCGAKSIGLSEADPEEIRKMVNKKGKALSQSELRLSEELVKTSKLIQRYGKPAAYVLAGKRLTPEDALKILKKEREINDRLFEMIMEAEKVALKRKFL